MSGAEDNALCDHAPRRLIDVSPGSVWHNRPLPLRPRLTFGPPRFAHPFEAEFAMLLDYYRMPWSYEPTTFALDWDARGRPVEFCTPDFYLPDQRLYVELTTVRQCLVTRKHRKVRLLRSRYPGVNITVLYRRDYERLLLSHVLDGDCDRVERAGKVLFSGETVERRVAELAAEIASSHLPGDEPPPLLIGAGSGASTFLVSLARSLNQLIAPIDVDTMLLAPFRRDLDATHRKVMLQRRPVIDPRGRRVVVVDGVISTGLSQAYLVRWLRGRGARSVDLCALLDRGAARVVHVPLTYTGFEAPHEIVVGYGLMRRRQFRDLPFIARLERDG